MRIRPAEKGDADLLAWALLASARSHLEVGMWDLMIEGGNQRVLDFLKSMTLTEQKHWSHYSTFLVSEIDGKPVAGMSGFFSDELDVETFRLGLIENNIKLGRTKEDSKESFARYGSIVLVAPEHEDGAWVIENVAVLPEYRRRGLVDALIIEVMNKGRELGAEIADIAVLIGNDAAQKAYEKNGFQVTGEKRHPEFEAAYACPGIRSLSREL